MSATNDRHERLIDLLAEQPSLSIVELSERLGVSTATIRRDLRRLSAAGRITRVRAGVAVASPYGIEPRWTERLQEHFDAKRAIARAAAETILDGHVVAIDTGTTAMEVARALQDRDAISIFTASLPVAEILATEHPTVHLVGGQLRPREMAVVGPLARDTIRRFHFDVFFVAAAAWSLEHGLMDFSIDDVEVKRAFMDASDRVVAIVDSSKFGGSSLMQIAELSDLDAVITDDGLDTEARAAVARSCELIIADARDAAAIAERTRTPQR